MIPPDFSVLLLAWDDADPGVAVLGGSALPPTLPLVYQLATQHPVLAVYPHLPATEATAALESSASAIAPVEAEWPIVAPVNDGAAAPDPLDAATDGPGVHLLASAASANSPAALAGGSRLVGLEDLLPAIQHALPTSHSLALGVAPGLNRTAAATPSTTARSQWPAHSGPPPAAAWQAPVAPYAGAAEAAKPTQVTANAQLTTDATGRTREAFPPPPVAPLRPEISVPGPSSTPDVAKALAASAPPQPAAILGTSVAPVTVSVRAPSAPVLVYDPAGPTLFDEPVEEMGAAEASALDAPTDDLVPDAVPLVATATETTAAMPVAAPDWAVRQPTLDGLNFRMIQYARRAAQLVHDRADFGVIYAPNWPAWLAALEIRNRSGQPLVLYVPALASATAPVAERGWLLGLERMALRRARLVLVPDAEVLHQLRAYHPDSLGEVRVVPAADEMAVQLVLAEVALG